MARDPFAIVLERIAELERRQGNFIRFVRVTKSHEDGRVSVTDDAGFDPEPVPQMSISAGQWTIDAPADAGAQGMLFSPEGDPSQGRFWPTLPSNEHPHASTQPKTLRLSGPNGVMLEITDGTITVKGGRIELGGTGGPGVARLGDQVTCPAGVGQITSSSQTVYAID